MLAEQEGVVVEAKPFDLHGVTYHDVSILYPDRTVDHARLGPEGAPENLLPGEAVLVTKVANLVVSLRRAS